MPEHTTSLKYFVFLRENQRRLDAVRNLFFFFLTRRNGDTTRPNLAASVGPEGTAGVDRSVRSLYATIYVARTLQYTA